MDVGTLNCSFVSEDKVVCNGTTYSLPESKLNIHDKSFWIYLAIYVALVLAAGSSSQFVVLIQQNNFDIPTFNTVKRDFEVCLTNYCNTVLNILLRDKE
jgi:hypothetical protein